MKIFQYVWLMAFVLPTPCPLCSLQPLCSTHTHFGARTFSHTHPPHAEEFPFGCRARVFVALLAKYFVIPYASALAHEKRFPFIAYAIPCTARFSCSGRLRQLRSGFLSTPLCDYTEHTVSFLCLWGRLISVVVYMKKSFLCELRC